MPEDIERYDFMSEIQKERGRWDIVIEELAIPQTIEKEDELIIEETKTYGQFI